MVGGVSVECLRYCWAAAPLQSRTSFLVMSPLPIFMEHSFVYEYVDPCSSYDNACMLAHFVHNWARNNPTVAAAQLADATYVTDGFHKKNPKSRNVHT